MDSICNIVVAYSAIMITATVKTAMKLLTVTIIVIATAKFKFKAYSLHARHCAKRFVYAYLS